MFLLLLLIISYGALLVLLMPASGVDVILTAVIFAVGVGLMTYKKVYKIAFWKSKQWSCILASVLMVAYCGARFYYRWLPSSKMQAIAAMLHIPIEAMLLIGLLILLPLALYFIYAVLQMITQKVIEYKLLDHFAIRLLCCLVFATVTVMLAQVMLGIQVFSMGYLKFLWGTLIVLEVILFLYCLIGRITPSVFVGVGIFMIISTINAYVYQFRGRLFEPLDIFAAGTAMNVADNYSLFPIPSRILDGWGIFAVMLLVLHSLQCKVKPKLTAKRRCVLLAVCVISSVATFLYAANIHTYHWHDEGARLNGSILDFVSKFKEMSVPKPGNYSTEQIAKLADQYAADRSEIETEPSEPPHIIVIMDEAFSDLGTVGQFNTNMEVTPFIYSLKENTVSGYALASVRGGNTANSEFEFLTGNSMAWLSPNAVPYQQYLRVPTYSMVSYLKSSYNYKCVAMHPFEASGWNRPTVYENLGFDEFYFVEDFPQVNYVRKYISDQEMFEFLIETYEAKKENPLFVFGVTMQNHGSYRYTGEDYTQYISLTDYGDEYPETEQYLSLLHETDKAVEYLITYFENTNEDVIIVFFGDHQPALDETFYEEISGTTANTLDEQQKRYKVPFFIWANYDIEEEYVDCTSLNYLSSYVYDAAGITLPPYNQFLQEMEDNIPAINANGFYSPTVGGYLPFDAANEEERYWLGLYEVLQYNNLFDKKHRNESIFPVLEH